MDWSDADAGHRTPGVEEGRINHFLEASEGSWPCQHLDFALLTSVTMREKVFVFQPLSLWYFTTALDKFFFTH